MRRLFAGIAVATVLGVGLAASTVWAEAKVTITREESKPKSVEVKVGEEVRWVNGSGGTAHVSFAGNDAVEFYVGKEGRVKFDKPGSYDYTVHITGMIATVTER